MRANCRFGVVAGVAAMFLGAVMGGCGGSSSSTSTTGATTNTIVRTLGSASATPGTADNVTLTVTPLSTVTSWSVSETPPTGWAVSNISSGGVLNRQAAAGSITWGPFSDHTARTFTYTVTPPAGASGTGTFTGSATFHGTTVNATGTRSAAVTSGTGTTAASPWPQFGANAQHTGLGVGQGSAGRVSWSFSSQPAGGLFSEGSCVVDGGGIVYGYSNETLYALKANGTTTPTVVWSFTSTNGNSNTNPPAIGPDGTIYTGDQSGFYALKANGTTTPTVVWTFKASPLPTNYPPAIGADGTVYVVSGNNVLYALKSNGSTTPTMVWSFATAGSPQAPGSSCVGTPAIGLDGTVYVTAGASDPTGSGFAGATVLYALQPNGTATPTVEWSYNTGVTSGPTSATPPAIGGGNTVYLGLTDPAGGGVVALQGNGTATPTVVWSAATGDAVGSTPAVGADGTVYVGLTANSQQPNSVVAFQPNGTGATTVWSFPTGGNVDGSPAIGADGTVYIGSTDHKVYAVKGGSSVWSFTTGAQVTASPAIGADGTVYIGSNDGKVYAFK
jgi:outer membrane protein assembly factor BamB